jgi:hypothetical protein
LVFPSQWAAAKAALAVEGHLLFQAKYDKFLLANQEVS